MNDKKENILVTIKLNLKLNLSYFIIEFYLLTYRVHQAT